MVKHYVPGMRGWTDIGSDVNWEDYGGKWARRAADSSYYVVDFTSMWETCGEDNCKSDGQDRYVVEVKRVDLTALSADQITRALECVSLDLAEVPEDNRETALVEACVSYGLIQPLESFSGDVYPARLRAQARRYAETCMRDAALLAERLARPVNKIGSTAEEYGRGDIDAALDRGPFDARKNLMRKLHGLPPG